MSGYEDLVLERSLARAMEKGDGLEELAIRRKIFDRTLDPLSGAPASVRGVVGMESRAPEDRLATLQQYYPDAVPYGDKNFVFTDPSSGKPTRYNPPGLELGDVTQAGRGIAEALGGIAGGLVGGAGGGPAAPLTTAAGVGLGAAGGVSAYDLGMGLLTPRVDTRTPKEILGGQALTAGVNMLGQRVGDYGLDLVRRGLSSAGAPQRLADLEAAGIPLRGQAGAVSGNKAIMSAEEALSWVPSSSRTVTDAAEASVDALQGRVGQVASEYAGGAVPSKVEIADDLIRGAHEGGLKFKTRQKELQKSYMDAIGADTRVPLDNVSDLLDDLTAQYAKSPKMQEYLEPAIDQLTKLTSDAADGDWLVPFGPFRNALTDVGQKLKDPKSATGYVGKSESEMKRVYAAMAADAEQAAINAGPTAKKALDLHNNYVRRINKEYLPMMDRIVKKDADKVYNFALEGSKDGTQRLRELKRNYTRDQWGKLAGSVIENMGKTTPGAQSAGGDAFSVNTFLTNWNKLAPEAKITLFDHNPELRNSLNRLARVTEGMKATIGARNTSRTAPQNLYMQILTGGGIGGITSMAASPLASVGAAAASTALPFGTAKLLTSPRFVRWLAALPNQPTKGIAGHIVRLGAIAEAEPALAEEIEQMQRQLRSAPTVR